MLYIINEDVSVSCVRAYVTAYTSKAYTGSLYVHGNYSFTHSFVMSRLHFVQ